MDTQIPLDDLFRLLRIPSVSCQPEHDADVRLCALELAGQMRRAGLGDVELISTARHPVVVGSRIVGQDRPTVLVYGHYDVQPAEPFELWTSPPFEPTVRDGKIYCRGATDDKGQFHAHLKAVEAFAGELPVNVKFVIEGEEEIGSLNFFEFLREHRERLRADVLVVSDGTRWEGEPTLVYGLRGLAFVQAECEDVFELSRRVASLKRDGRITIPGFYDGVVEPTEAERELLRRLPYRELGFAEGEPGYTELERRMVRPTLEVNGFAYGPPAMAKITCRLVPGQEPARIAELLAAQLPCTIKKAGGKPWLTPPDHPALQAAHRALKGLYGKDPLYCREGGTIPAVVHFQEALGLPGILLGFGLQSDNLHAPDEHFHVEHYYQGVRMAGAVLRELAQLPAA